MQYRSVPPTCGPYGVFSLQSQHGTYEFSVDWIERICFDPRGHFFVEYAISSPNALHLRAGEFIIFNGILKAAFSFWSRKLLRLAFVTIFLASAIAHYNQFSVFFTAFFANCYAFGEIFTFQTSHMTVFRNFLFPQPMCLSLSYVSWISQSCVWSWFQCGVISVAHAHSRSACLARARHVFGNWTQNALLTYSTLKYYFETLPLSIYCNAPFNWREEEIRTMFLEIWGAGKRGKGEKEIWKWKSKKWNKD